MKLGCNTVLFGGYSLRIALEHIKWAGYDGVELAAIPSMANHLRTGAGEEHLRGVQAELSHAGLEPFAIEAAMDLTQEANQRRMREVFELASKLGIPVVTSGSGGKAGDEESLTQVIGIIEDLGNAAQASGVKLAIKPHVGVAIYNTPTALRLLKSVSSSAVGINYDPTHLARAGEVPEESALQLREGIIHVHIRDYKSEGQGIGPPENQIAGRGVLNLPAILSALHEISYGGVADLEIIGAKEYPLSRVMGIAAESAGYFRRCLEELKKETGWEA